VPEVSAHSRRVLAGAESLAEVLVDVGVDRDYGQSLAREVADE